ncbi:hypothetical protein L6452_43391 [Arctium lappa]|uniref:Uncharacterized protein n=1 Tax=Arctium lappa TaxID=4217 RepID=A0ACB8XKX4_ARCLA|nr:hypothetical protein L6452_43391 [Arctium lappa]
MEIEDEIESPEVKLFNQSAVNSNLSDNMDVNDLNLEGMDSCNVSKSVPENMRSYDAYMNNRAEILGNYIINSDQYLKETIKMYEARIAMSTSHEALQKSGVESVKVMNEEKYENPTVLSSAVNGTKPVMLNSVLNDVNAQNVNFDSEKQGDKSTGQRPKSGLDISNENNRENLIKMGMNSASFVSGGKGGFSVCEGGRGNGYESMEGKGSGSSGRGTQIFNFGNG